MWIQLAVSIKLLTSLKFDKHSIYSVMQFKVILFWEIPWTEEPGRVEPMGSQKSQTQPKELNDNKSATLLIKKKKSDFIHIIKTGPVTY